VIWCSGSLKGVGALYTFAEGHPIKEIAKRLNVSVKTVGAHREHVMAKLQIRGIAELTRYAVREGITSIEAHLGKA
jgi:two-component system secretion response regulator SsrB